jgi:SAM-dependent methyltransferase
VPKGEGGTSRWELETFDYDRLHLRIQKIVDEVLDASPHRVLELGCGVGVMRRALLSRNPALEYWGCDISHAAVAQLGDPRVVQCDIGKQGVPFPGERFDCIAGSGILEYVPDLSQLLESLRERLAPDGRLVVSYYNMGHVSRRVLRALGRTPHVHPEWRNQYTLDEVETILVNAGFEVERQLPVDICLRRPVTKLRQSSATRWAQAHAPFQHALAAQMIFSCTLEREAVQ